MANGQKTNFVTSAVARFPITGIIASITAGATIPWADLMTWATSLIPFAYL